MFKVNKFWYLYCWLCTYFKPCSSVSIVNFEQVNVGAGWEVYDLFMTIETIYTYIYEKNIYMNNMKDKSNDYQLVFNITHHPNFSKLKDTMSFLHLLLTPDQEHQKVFHKVPIIGFRRAKSLKDILVRAKVPPLQKNEGFCVPCKKSRCEICKQMVNTNSFK